MSESSGDTRRRLPSVDRLLQDPSVRPFLDAAPRSVVVAAIREAVEEARQRGGRVPDSWADEIRHKVVRRTAPSLAPVYNATGVVLHTNLGRAPLAPAAMEAVASTAAGYSTLEFDLTQGTRGSRNAHCRGLLAELTGAEAGLVVNNAAGALVLGLNELAAGKDVLLSRGELIEIGGSFRIPDILGKSGAVLREVGTTNRTHLEDYRAALGGATGAILTVHQSNFAQTGFVASPAPAELAALAREAGVPYLYDVGSGLLVDLARWGLQHEPLVQDAIRLGADLVMFSGDKLLGGPQAGCLVGRAAWVERCQRNPLARALRSDKSTLAALEATLMLYRDPVAAIREIPVLQMLTTELDVLESRARALADVCPAKLCPVIQPGESAVGGGSFAGARLPTRLVVLNPGTIGAERYARALRVGTPAIVARVADERVMLDPRTLPAEAFSEIGSRLARALEE
ncbi:MAG: L-seryl-tRNA(Sec) selenium transferase [Gemmatimonadales bacterium]|nr:L-seryl-tRNA(Sec) selenium transferase [Gemmatimonadales bacterium]